MLKRSVNYLITRYKKYQKNLIIMKILKILSVFIVCLTLIISCTKEDDFIEENVIDTNQKTTTQENQKYPEIAKKLESMYFNTDELELIELELLDGTIKEMFLVEGDIIFSRKEIEEMKMEGEPGTRQYHTWNLVNNGTYTIIGYTGNNSNGLSTNEQIALSWAVDNYNRLNLDIHLNLSFGTNWVPKDIVVYRNSNIGFTGGLSDFPSGGKPYKFVQINGLGSYTTNVVEHVITHEIGHSFGLRHTDWRTRISCGSGSSGESGGFFGLNAMHIPGTPTGYDPNSLMLACFSSTEDGEFGYYDKVALRYLY